MSQANFWEALELLCQSCLFVSSAVLVLAIRVCLPVVVTQIQNRLKCVFVCMYVCMYVCVCVCVCACIHCVEVLTKSHSAGLRDCRVTLPTAISALRQSDKSCCFVLSRRREKTPERASVPRKSTAQELCCANSIIFHHTS